MSLLLVRARRYRVSFDVGPGASFADLAQILTDLDTLSSVAADWANREDELAAEKGVSSGGDVSVAAARQGGAKPVIEIFTYRNPADFILECTPLLIGLFTIAQKWHVDHKNAVANTTKAEAEAAKLFAEAHKISAETGLLRDERVQNRERDEAIDALRSDLQGALNSMGANIDVDELLGFLENHPNDALGALARLGRLSQSVEELSLGPATAGAKPGQLGPDSKTGRSLKAPPRATPSGDRLGRRSPGSAGQGQSRLLARLGRHRGPKP